MKNFGILALFIFLLLITGSLGAYQGIEEEVVFTREYRQYGWKEYGADAVKLPHPIQTLVDFHLIEYRLNSFGMTITKLSPSHPPVRTVLLITSLNHEQQRAVQQMLRTVRPNLIQQQCDNSTVVTDDGFHLDVTLIKPDMNKSFRWNGNYIRELVYFMDMANTLSPEKYKFYQAKDEHKFKQSIGATYK